MTGPSCGSDAGLTAASAGAANAHAIRPVFVVGCPRSGTTLVQRLVTGHPEVFVGGETHYVERFVRRRPRVDLRDDVAWSALLDEVVGVPEFGESGASADRFRSLAATGSRTLRTPFAAWMLAMAEAHGATVVGEKTPNHLLHLPLLKSWFPTAVVVGVVRDPRAVCVSTRRVWWSAGSARADARAWRRYESAMTRYADLIDLVVSFEAMAHEPERVVADIDRTLGVAPRTTVRTTAWDARGVDVQREPWKARVAGPVDASVAERWRGELAPVDVHAVEAVCWRGMRRRGYGFESGPRDIAARSAAEELMWWGRQVQNRVGGAVSAP